MFYRRARGDIIEVYKILHGKYDVDHALLGREESRGTRGHSLKLKKPRCRLKVRQNFFGVKSS
jgi:hypothetical protein